jgi:hypothetical protein
MLAILVLLKLHSLILAVRLQAQYQNISYLTAVKVAQKL